MDLGESQKPRRPPIGGTVLAIALLLHGAALALFTLVALPRRLYSEPAYIFYGFLLVSSALSVTAYLASRKAHYRVLLFVRVLMFVLFCSPFGSHLAIRLVLVMILILETCTYEGFPTSLILCAAAVLSSLAFMNLLYFISRDPGGDLLQDLIVYVLSAALLALIGSLMTKYRERLVEVSRETGRLHAVVDELSRAQLTYLDYVKATEERSARQERDRLSAELHDSIGYTFTNLKMMLEAGKDLIDRDSDGLRGLLETGLTLVSQAMRETRRTLYLLRGEHEPPPFLSAVHKMVRVFQDSTGVQVTVNHANFPMNCSSEEVELTLYHFVQEGLVNAFRHGKASRVHVLFWTDDEKLQVSIQDDGLGADALVEGIGMRGMRERLGRLGGTLGIRNRADGFHIVAQIPLKG